MATKTLNGIGIFTSIVGLLLLIVFGVMQNWNDYFLFVVLVLGFLLINHWINWYDNKFRKISGVSGNTN